MNKIPAKLERIVCDHLDDELCDGDREHFEALLRRDSAALDALCSHALLLASLNRQADMGCDADRGQVSLWRHRGRGHLLFAITAIGAVALAAGSAVRHIIVHRSGSGADLEVAPNTIFAISGNESQSHLEKLNLGEILNISQGSASLTLADGTVCIAEAPAKLALRARDHVEISGGLVTFRAGPESANLTVSTSTFEAVNLGSSFGIDDRRKGQSQLHVFDGKVRATTLTGSLETSVLSAGHATAAGSNGVLRPIPADALRFPSALPSGLPAARFSFDVDPELGLFATGSLAKSCGIRMVETLRSSNPQLAIEGRFGHAIHFSSPDQSLRTTWPGIAGVLPRTISLWIKIDDADRSAGGHILGWGLPSGGELMSQFSLIYSGSNRAALRVVSGRRWLQGITRLDDGGWHHLAIVLDSYTPGGWPNIMIYLDGKPETLVPRNPEEGHQAPLDSFNTITDHPRSIPLTFGRFQRKGNLGAFAGSIDEVVIATGILTESQIQALHSGRLDEAGLALPRRVSAPR